MEIKPINILRTKIFFKEFIRKPGNQERIRTLVVKCLHGDSEHEIQQDFVLRDL